MPLFGSERDISFFKNVNRELLWDIITQQVSIYKLKLNSTQFNVYGEASGDKFYSQPVLLNCLIERGDREYVETEFGSDVNWEHTFNFLNDDLEESKILPEIGDLLMYENRFYEIHDITKNQLFVGKDPNYPNEPQPEKFIPNKLDKFGWNVATRCFTTYIPSDKTGIIKERII